MTPEENQMTNPKPPPWRYMYASTEQIITKESDIYAARLRVIRDRIVPEEPPPHRGMRAGGLTCQEMLNVERQRIRAKLTREIKRAEVGE